MMKMKTLDYLLELSKVIATIVAKRDTRVRIALTRRKVQGTMVVKDFMFHNYFANYSVSRRPWREI